MSVGGVLFALVTWQLLGYWGISLTCWRGLSGPVWKVEPIGSLQQDHIPPSRPPGTLGPRAGLAMVGRAGWSHGVGHRAHPGKSHHGDLAGRVLGGIPFSFLTNWDLRYMPLPLP